MNKLSFRMGKDQSMPSSPCTACGHNMDAASCVSEDGQGKAEPGDFTVCIACGHVMAFGNDLQLRDLTDEETKVIAGNEQLLAIQKARSEVMKEHPELKDRGADICTCDWSPVNTMTEDPPHIIYRDPDCPRHGEETE